MTKRELINIIKACSSYGVAEIEFEDVKLKFKASGEKPEQRQQTSFAVEEPINSLEKEDEELDQELLGITDPSAYWEKRERGDINSAEEDS